MLLWTRRTQATRVAAMNGSELNLRAGFHHAGLQTWKQIEERFDQEWVELIDYGWPEGEVRDMWFGARADPEGHAVRFVQPFCPLRVGFEHAHDSPLWRV
jgi:hypothetical protein